MTPYGYASRFDIHFDDKFEVSFGREGETMSLGCRVVITPEIKHFSRRSSGTEMVSLNDEFSLRLIFIEGHRPDLVPKHECL